MIRGSFKLKRAKESGEWHYQERESPQQDARPQLLGLFAEEQRDFVTSEEFRAFIREEHYLQIGKVPIHFFGNIEKFDRVISPETAYIMTDIMKAVIKEGTGILSNSLNSFLSCIQ